MAGPWWQSAVVYQIYPRSFADSDGDGIGDLRGITSKLDHLVALGVDVLWLSPIYRSPHDDNGYDISDHQGIDPLFGTLADSDELLAAVHARGMRLVMDLVVNHTSDEHAWFAESRASTTSAKRDLYWWRPAREGHEPGAPRAEPTSWESFFSGSVWEYDAASGEYYLHLFSRKQPDLNRENPEVGQAVYAMMRWWVDRGVDGFRMDVINMISKDIAPDGSLPDGAGLPGGALGDGSPFYLNGPRVHEYLQEMNREVLAGRGLLAVGETPGAMVADAQRYSDPARAEIDMVFTFEHVQLDTAPGGTKWDLAPLRLTDLKTKPQRMAGGPRRARVELPVLGQPRPAAHRVALGRRRRAPRDQREDPRHRAAPAPRHAVRPPGRGAGHDQRPLHLAAAVPRHRVRQPGDRGARTGGAGGGSCGRWP